MAVDVRMYLDCKTFVDAFREASVSDIAETFYGCLESFLSTASDIPGRRFEERIDALRYVMCNKGFETEEVDKIISLLKELKM